MDIKERSATWLALALTVATALVLYGGTAFAQEADPRSEARIHAGPLHISPRLVLQDMGVDSNIFNSATAPESDFTVTMTPSLDLATGIRRALFTVRSATDFVYFANHAAERSVNQRLAATGRLGLRRFALFTQASYRNARGRSGDEIDARVRQREFTGEARIGMTVSPRLSAQVSHRQVQFEFDQNAIFDDTRLAESLNRHTRTFTASIRYAVTPLTALIASADAGAALFPLAPSRDSDTRSASVAIELHPRALISGSATVGYERFRSRNGSLPGFTGLIGSVNVSYRAPGSMVLGLSADRGLTYSYMEEDPYFVAEGYRVSIRRQLVERLDVDVAVRRFWDRYQPATATPVPLTTRQTETVREDSAGLGYRVSPSTQFRVGVSYWQRRSDQRRYRNFDGIRAGASVVYGF